MDKKSQARYGSATVVYLPNFNIVACMAGTVSVWECEWEAGMEWWAGVLSVTSGAYHTG